MAYASNFRVLTANRLADGRVVYLGDRDWTADLGAARLVQTDADAEIAERAGREAVAARLVVEPYLIDVEAEDRGVQPVRLRERIRASGPTTGNAVAGNAATGAARKTA
ncbi:DUF2849 domain-containing protein [Microbaculum sp. FT89]|uniref:DUF2849 domain-containing protein n=1 Tax=Microbaculum sp. FT89 TaxID=3447298 RepID=UPI003F538E1E